MKIIIIYIRKESTTWPSSYDRRTRVSNKIRKSGHSVVPVRQQVGVVLVRAHVLKGVGDADLKVLQEIGHDRVAADLERRLWPEEVEAA